MANPTLVGVLCDIKFGFFFMSGDRYLGLGDGVTYRCEILRDGSYVSLFGGGTPKGPQNPKCLSSIYFGTKFWPFNCEYLENDKL